MLATAPLAPFRIAVVLLTSALLLVACITPEPPRPAMVPYGTTGAFGYSQRDLGPDRVEVEYRGAAVPVLPTQPRNDPRTAAELDKARDLALWRAAQIAVERSRAGLKIESENRDSNIEVRHQSVYRPNPFYDPFFYEAPYPGRFHRRFDYFSPPYEYQDVSTATVEADVKLTIVFFVNFDPKADGMLSAAETIARLQTVRGGAAY